MLSLEFSSWSSMGESELGYGLWNNRALSVFNHSNFKAVLGDIKAKTHQIRKSFFPATTLQGFILKLLKTLATTTFEAKL